MNSSQVTASMPIDQLTEGSNKKTKDAPSKYLSRIKKYIHQQFIDSFELAATTELTDPNEWESRINDLMDQFEIKIGAKIEPEKRQTINNQVIQEVNGYGPLSQLMSDPAISDILINGASDIWIDRNGKLTQTDIQFDDQNHLQRFIDRLIAGQGKRLDSQSPSVDAKLADGSRLHAIIPPLCQRGPVVSIRRFIDSSATADSLLKNNMLDQAMLDFLSLATMAGHNIIIAGGASAGKTTLLNALSEFIPHSERIITIEESSELKLRHPHVVSLETRQSNTDGHGQFSIRALLRNALRMRADRIIIGEVRGEEVFDMLQAMTVGHDGSMTTVHANHPKDVIGRLESLALLSNENLPLKSIQNLIGSAINIVVQITRSPQGRRYITHICEVDQINSDLSVNDIFNVTPKSLALIDNQNSNAEHANENLSDEKLPIDNLLHEDIFNVAYSPSKTLSRLEEKGFQIPVSLSVNQPII